jgi:ATP-dependent helicase HepA
MTLGYLVYSTDNQLGIGKLIATNAPNATVEYFCSAGQRLSQIVLLESIRRVRLSRQTRCYTYNPYSKTWRIGRIYTWDEDEEQYQIDLPDRHTILAPESDIYVRCNLPIEDPIDILAMKGHETPYFHNQRSRFIRCLTQQRAISRGITGLISANIALYPHQVEVIRRVLEDPIQRYLLADEVGLGKTIEAGVILRQFLLDEPRGKALILVPPYLLHQWQQELQEKLYFSEFGERFTLLSTTDWPEIPATDYDFLILDEAHHIASMSHSTLMWEKRCFKTIQTLAHNCDRLLLLSATPVLHHEQDFLAMLHLLEPDTYQLQDLEGFREKIEKRQEIGRLLLSFKAETNPINLQANLTQLQKLFPEDSHLIKLIETLQKSLKTQENTEQEGQIRSIRTHISDTYRLHRRMLRNRRANVTDVIFARHTVPRPEYDLDERCYDIHDLLEEWRTTAPNQPEYYHLFRLLVATSNTWLEIFKQVIESRLNELAFSGLTQDLGEQKIQKITKTPKFAREQTILSALLKLVQNPSADGDRLELLKIVLLYHLSDILKLQSFRSDLNKLQERIKQRIERPFTSDKLPKLVIFTLYTQACAAIVDLLANVFGSNAVASHSFKDNRDTVDANLKRFKNHAQCFLLVCDPSGEEGTNLQFVDGVIHFDLPFSPNKLEQRLGRMDRIGSKMEVLSWVLVGIDSPDSYQDAWYEILKDGLGIFNESIASLQFYVEQKLPELEQILFQQGAKGLRENIPNLQAEINSENIKISEQNTLDEIDTLDKNALEYFQLLEEHDNQHQIIEKAVEGWLCSALNFRKKYDVNMKDVRQYKYTERTLVSVAEIKEKFSDCVTHKGAYNRRIANQYPGVHLYRIGEKLIDTLADYIYGDDRGTAFAMWRQDSSWEPTKNKGSEWLGFRFDYVLEINWKKIQTLLQDVANIKYSHSAIKRRTDSLFPPLLRTLFLDTKFQPVLDEELIKILKRPYKSKGERNRDYNLAKERRFIVDEFVNKEDWEKLCYQARTASEALLLEHCSDYYQRQITIAKEILDNQINQLKLRLGRTSQQKLSQEIEQETILNQVLLDSISQPYLRLDAVGFIILSGNTLSEEPE